MSRASNLYAECRLCPRRCGVDRRTFRGSGDGNGNGNGERGICGETDRLRLALAGLHFGEEPPITGTGGSGALFVTGCALRCPFCQNWQVSRCGGGREVGKEEFVALAFRFQAAGAENLNLVTPSHMAPTLADYLVSAKEAGLHLPVVWNSSAYESTEVIDLVAPLVDIWLPDLKTLDPETAGRVYGVPAYPEAAADSIRRMAGQTSPVFDSRNQMKRGVIVRHLVIPGEIPSTLEVIAWFAGELGDRARLSVMTQYTPVAVPGEDRPIPPESLEVSEYEKVRKALEDHGVEGYYQELVVGDDWLPDFDRLNPFGSDLSKILWKHHTGFVSPGR